MFDKNVLKLDPPAEVERIAAALREHRQARGQRAGEREGADDLAATTPSGTLGGGTGCEQAHVR